MYAHNLLFGLINIIMVHTEWEPWKLNICCIESMVSYCCDLTVSQCSAYIYLQCVRLAVLHA